MSQIIQYNSGGGGGGTVTSVSGGHDINITGTATINPTVNLNNAITLGDLSVVLAGNSSVTLTSGDLTISGTGVGAGGNLNLPSTSSANVGVIEVGGGPWLHSFGGNNIFLGSSAGNFSTTGEFNIGIGQSTLDNVTTGEDNVAVGVGVMDHLTSSTANTGIGTEALNQLDQTGAGASNFNTAVGWHAGFNLENATNNTLIGAQAGEGLVSTGSFNTVIGANSGSDYSGGENSNICISNLGVSGDNNTIRIGTQGSGDQQQDTCFIAGIAGVTTSNSQFVTIDTTTGQLGSTTGGGGSGIAIINGNVSSVTGSAITLTGGTSGAIFTGNGTTTMTESFNFLELPNSNSGGTIGYISFNAIPFMHNGGSTANSMYLGPSNGNFTASAGSNYSIGTGCLLAVAAGFLNIAIGSGALPVLTDGLANIAIGTSSLSGLLTGQANTAIGYTAGAAYSGAESSNILIGNAGVLGESNVIRIGNQGSSTAQQNSCFIAGIAGITTSNSEMVTIDTTTGELGSAPIPGGGGFTWSVITANQTAAVGNGYICNKAGLLTLTLPTTSAAGSIIEVTGMNTAVGWRIAQGSGQTIHFGNMNTTTGTGGYLESTAIYDSVRLVCNIANTDWIVLSSEGNITIN